LSVTGRGSTGFGVGHQDNSSKSARHTHGDLLAHRSIGDAEVPMSGPIERILRASVRHTACTWKDVLTCDGEIDRMWKCVCRFRGACADMFARPRTNRPESRTQTCFGHIDQRMQDTTCADQSTNRGGNYLCARACIQNASIGRNGREGRIAIRIVLREVLENRDIPFG
jgi:hypothetical protein